MLLKDYVVDTLTGKLLADRSIATFSFYFDIYKNRYWDKMLVACGIREDQLPPLIELCTVAGKLTDNAVLKMGLTKDIKVNVGTLDHFAGMIGTGNIEPGTVSLSIGTVMAMATFAGLRNPASGSVAMHYGFIPETYVILPVIENGGICLEWLKKICLGETTLRKVDKVLLERNLPNNIIFLPYIAGQNAPEFDSTISGIFYGIKVYNDQYDMAAAVMEGVAFLLKKNCESISNQGIEISHIVATGGGSKSPVWCQMQADITGIPIAVPKENEAACLGTAMIAAVSEGVFRDYFEAISKGVVIQK